MTEAKKTAAPKKKAPAKADWDELEKLAVSVVAGKRSNGPALVAKIKGMRG